MNLRMKFVRDWGRLDLRYKTLADFSIGGGRYGIAASAVEKSDTLPTYLRITDICDDGTLDFSGLKSVDNKKSSNYKLKPNDMVFARTGGSVGRNYFYDRDDGEFIFAGFLIKFSIDRNSCNPRFIKYYCQTQEYRDWVKSVNSGSTRGNINAKTYEGLPIPDIGRERQDLIVDTLSILDTRITMNKKINHHLEQMAQAIWSERFRSREPNGVLGDIIELFDSKRVPLSGNQREKMEKFYPYYGATSLMDYVDDYLFDGIYLLLGEDGTVIDNSGFPILQYIWDKFWVNNHAHVIQGRNGFTVESLYILLKQTSVSAIVTGAVQHKINQANLKSLAVVVPSVDEMAEFNALIEPLFARIRSNFDENRNLVNTRDTLLPKLMSGELSLADL